MDLTERLRRRGAIGEAEHLAEDLIGNGAALQSALRVSHPRITSLFLNLARRLRRCDRIAQNESEDTYPGTASSRRIAARCSRRS